MKYVFDIDGTICKTNDADYENSLPIMERINKINSLYDDGHTIVYFTARGMGRTGGNRDAVYELFYPLTKGQLIKWKAKHHELILGKPDADFFIDDKGTNDHIFFEN